ncbi:MAG: serine/threonine-protein kinase [Planctomycetaceae bacterium]
MTPRPPEPAQLEETLVVSPLSADTDRSADSQRRVQLVAGSGSRLEGETQSVLRVRLRAAALVLFAGVGAFFIRDWFIPDAPLGWFRAATLALFAAAVTILSSSAPLSLKRLRVIEAAMFGLIALYLGVYEYQLVLRKARAGDPTYALAAIKSCILYFFAVILLYGTFIPNTWQRAARTIVPMALVSFVVLGLLRMRYAAVDQFARHVANFEQISDHVIMMTLGVVSALYGTHIINSLRVEAFKARQMGQYHLKELLGAGGMGEVYLAEHSLLKRPCAIKLIRPGDRADPVALARFEREVRTTAALTHWNTVNIFDYGRTDDGTFYYVMEYLPGLSLNDLVKRFGALSAARTIHLLRQTCRALREAHAANMIHRDIKPANIFVARLGGICDVVKLLDFGLVRQAAEESPGASAHDQAFSGSPLYMAPEQAKVSERPDARSDIYSMGACGYFALTGRVPFEGTNAVQVLVAHARDAVVPPSQVRPEVPADLERVILKCLAKRPADRFAGAVELERALAACAEADGWNDELAQNWWAEAGLIQSPRGEALSQTPVDRISNRPAVV